MSEKAANVQRKTLEDLQTAWRTKNWSLRTALKTVAGKPCSLEAKYKEMRVAQDFCKVFIYIHDYFCIEK